MVLGIQRLVWVPVGTCFATLAIAWVATPPSLAQALGAAAGMLAVLLPCLYWNRHALVGTGPQPTEECAQLRAVFDNLPFPVWLKDAQGTYLLANPCFTHYLGLPPAQTVLGRTDADVGNTQYAAIFSANDAAVRHGSQPIEQDVRSGTDAAAPWFWIYKSPVQSAGQPAILGTAIDISQRKNAERRNNLLNYALDQCGDMVGLMKMEAPALLYANQAASTILGYSHQELTSGIGATDLVPSMDLDLYIAVGQRLRDKGPDTFVTEMRRKNGQLFPAEITASRFEFEGDEFRLSVCRDISERHRNEAQLARLTANMPGFAYTLQRAPDGRDFLSYTSPGIWQIYGLHPADVADSIAPLRQMLEPEDAARMGKAVNQAMRDGMPYSVEARVHHPHKGLVWIETRATPARLPDGTEQWHGFTMDITARKQIERQLVVKERYQRALLDNFPFPVWLKDQDGHFLATNQDAANAVGVQSPEEMVGKTDSDFFSPSLATRFYADEQQAMASGQQFHEEQRMGAEPNSPWFEIYRKAVSIDGELIGTTGFAHDITQRKAEELRLKLVMEALNRVADSVTLNVWGDPRFIYVNETICNVLGYTAKELTGGMTVFDIDPMITREGFDQLMETVPAGLVGHSTIETVHRTRSGQEFDMEVHVNYFEFDGERYTLAVCRNVTQRKAEQYRLQLLNEALNRVADSVFMLRLDSPALTYANDTMASVLGYSVAELTGGVTLFDVEPGLSQERFVHVSNVLREQKSAQFESTLRTKTGTDIPVEIHVDYFVYAEVAYALAIARDISDRQAMQKRLVDSEQQFRSLAENITDTIQCIDLQGRRLYANPAMRALYQEKYGPEIDAADGTYSLLEGESQQVYDRAIQQVLATGREEQVEVTFSTRPPVVQTLVARIMPQRNADGLVEGAITVCRDVTSLMQTEASLKKINRALALGSETNLAIAKASDLGELLDTVCQLMVEVGGYATVGIGRAEADAAKNVTMLTAFGPLADLLRHVSISWDAEGSRLGVLGRCIATGEPVLVTDTLTDPRVLPGPTGGVSRGVRSMLSLPLLVNGVVWGALHADSTVPNGISDDDVSLLSEMANNVAFGIRSLLAEAEMRTAELALYESSLGRQLAESASKTKSEFLATMSHEIRTPMNGVLGMTGLLLETSLTDEQREYAETVKNSGDALLRIINDILDYSKIEAGKLELEVLDFNLRTLMDEIADVVAFRIGDKPVECAWLADGDVPSQVRGDPGRLRQVLLNLAGNATKFTMAGEVTLHLMVVEKSAAQVRLRIEVRDSGIGIAPDKLAQLFVPFTQADSSTTRRFGGTGLGLAISKQLVDLMGGTIGARSVWGQGSVFWFELPLDVQPREPQVEPLPPAKLVGMRVLVVDDNATNRRLLQILLQNWGLQVITAEDGNQAMHALLDAQTAGHRVDVAILDMQMPTMSGETLGRLMQANPVWAGVPLVMLTSVAQRGDGARLKAAGFSAFLTKPLKGAQLLRCMQTVLAGPAAPTLQEVERVLVTRHTLADDRTPSRVLLVEDNPVNLKLALILLKKWGHQVLTAVNGAEALEVLRTHAADVVLMDCHMPEMDGYEATQRIRAGAAGAHQQDIPIIALTANAMVGDRAAALAAGMDDHISKPIDAKVLRAAVRHWHGKRSGAITLFDSPPKPEDNAVDASPGEAFSLAQLGRYYEDDLALAATVLGPLLDDLWLQLAPLQQALRLQRHGEVRARLQAVAAGADAVGGQALSHTVRALCAQLDGPQAVPLAAEQPLLGCQLAALANAVTDWLALQPAPPLDAPGIV